MPEPRPRPKPNALVASAKILTAERLNQPKTAAWQEECWGHFDLQGELWFATLWKQNALSKIRLFAAIPPQNAGDEPTPIETGPAVDLMGQFAGGVAGQGAVMAATSVHLDVPGEGFLVARTDNDETSWVVCSNDELKVVKNGWQMKMDAKTWEPLPEECLVIRVWRPHARRKWLADSPTRHALGALREIQRCNEHIDATLVSRLAGSGLLIMPNEVSFPHTEASEGKDDPFFYELLEAMRAPIKDRGVAGAVVPLPVRVPGDQVANFKHLTFASQLDKDVLALRVNAIERFATTVDFPAEILNGKETLNHWGAWQVGEEALQMHIEPAVELICDAYTKGYLKPALASMGADTNAMIWYDTSELAVRPDRSADAKWAFADAIIGPHAVIRETGFTEDDRPTAEEFEEMVGWKLLGVRGGAALALALLKVDYDPALLPPDEGGTGTPNPVQPGQDPGLVGPDTPGVDSPGTPPPSPIQANPPSASPDLPSQAATLLVADQLVYRALERAGNRLRSLRKGKLTAEQDCPPAMMHECLGGVLNGNGDKPIKAADLLEGAWERVPEAAEALGEDPVKMQRALQRYCVGLFTTGDSHSVERLAEFLADELPQTIGTLASGDGMQMALVREMSRTMGRLAETMAHQPPPVTNVTVVAPSGEVREPQA